MTRFFLFFWLYGACFAIQSFGQTSPLSDSIVQQLKLVPDSAKATWLLQKGSDLTAAHPQQALPILKAARELLMKSSRESLKATVLNDLATCYTQLESYSDALPLLLEAEKILLRIKADSLLIDTYTNLGILYERTEKYEKAIVYYNKVRTLLIAGKASPMELARNLTNIGHAQEGLKLFAAAVVTYEQALQLCEQNNIPFGIALLN